MINYNIRPYVVINGNDSRSIPGLLVCTLPPITLPPKRTVIETIDGRDGDVVNVLGYEAYDKSFEIGLTEGYNVDDIISFFDASGRVVFGNEPDKYYNFATYQGINFERLLRFRKATVTFHVQPFKYAEAEDEARFTFHNTDAIIKARNDGNIFSRPTITIKGVGVQELYINDELILTIELPYDPDGTTITINAADMEAYDINGGLSNRLVTGNYDNIQLKSGLNYIRVAGSVQEVVISHVSRWI